MIKKLTSLLVFLILILFATRTTFAEEPKFSTSYDISYKVAESGRTTITQNYHLTNLTTEYYASEYVINVKDEKINKLRASDRTGNLEVTTEAGSPSGRARIKFRDIVVGKGNTLNFSISYESDEVAVKNGRIWEIFIPRPAQIENVSNYSIGLYVPKSFGPPIYQKPLPSASGNIWKKENIGVGGITVAFSPFSEEENGPYQTFDFRLIYHLENTRLYGLKTEIALPPDTNYQKVFLTKLTPQPENVRIDADGNFRAIYALDPSTKIDVTAIGQAMIFHRPTFPKPEKDSRKYLKGAEFWEAKDPKIASLANALKTPEEIYKYVVKNLKYNESKIGKDGKRLGAKEALERADNAICMEFTDLFIALSRAAGIPAREVNGYALTHDKVKQPLSLKDVLHAWPEYYDFETQNWIMVDPTWENTTGGVDYFHTLDFNHFAFVIHGEDSVEPYPAGAYKTNRSQKDVHVSPKEDELDANLASKLSIGGVIPKEIVAVVPSIVSLEVFNPGPTVTAQQELLLSASIIDFKNNKSQIPAMPPFARFRANFQIDKVPFLADASDIITARTGSGEIKTFQTKVTPIYKSLIVIIGGTIAAGFSIFITEIARRLFLQRRRKQDSLRGEGKIPA